VLLCGDLNAVPGGGTLATLATQLQPLAPDSSVRSTFPTPLRADLAGHPGAVLDHILGRGVVVVEWGVAGDEPIDGIWPSDHLAIWARVRPVA
jgi:endonuclease/exonuclease/phosphatase (EEP) superfamily protein YafD